MESSINKLVTIMNSPNLFEIQIAKSKLELEGIQSYSIDEHINSTIGTAFVEGYKLEVSSLDVEKALKIINEISE